MSFKRTQENFICEHCGKSVIGNGYTNHCPYCLWSKHVDIDPGDRMEECGGLMKPIDIYLEHQDWVIVHKCERCGASKRKKVVSEDNFDEVIRLEEEINRKKIKGK